MWTQPISITNVAQLVQDTIMAINETARCTEVLAKVIASTAGFQITGVKLELA